MIAAIVVLLIPIARGAVTQLDEDSHSWSIWDSGVDFSEILTPLSAPPQESVSAAPLDDKFFERLPRVIQLRQAMSLYVSYLGEKIAESPKELESAAARVQNFVMTCSEIVSCSDVEISGVNVPADILKTFSSLLIGGNRSRLLEFLKEQDKRIACWLIDSHVKKLEHKKKIKEASLSRIHKVLDISRGFIADIDYIFTSQDTPEALNAFWWTNMDIFPTTRGKWALSVQRHMEARNRLEAIRSEIARFKRSKKEPSVFCQEDRFKSELNRVLNLHFNEGYDSSLVIQILNDGLSCFPMHEIDIICNKILDNLNSQLCELASFELTMTFILTGESPIRQYSSRPEL
jgi:hypothetical protein